MNIDDPVDLVAVPGCAASIAYAGRTGLITAITESDGAKYVSVHLGDVELYGIPIAAVSSDSAISEPQADNVASETATDDTGVLSRMLSWFKSVAT